MIEIDLQTLTSSRALPVAALGVACLLGGCVNDAGLGDAPGETDGAAGTDSSVDTLGDTESDSEGETDGVDTMDAETEGDTDGVPSGAAGCERIAGADGELYDWAIVCASVASDDVQLLEVTPGGDVVVGIAVANIGDVEAPVWDVGGNTYEHQDLTDLLLLRFDAQGELLWHRYFGADHHVWFTGMAACGEDIVIAGDASDGVDLGEGTVTADEFVARYDAEGELVWSRGFDAQQPDGHITTQDLECDAAGNVVVTGRVRDGADFGLGMQAAAIYDAFVVRLDATGATSFAHTLLADAEAGGSFQSRGMAVAAHDDGSTYLFVDHSGPVDVGTGPIDNPLGGENALLLRLSETGELLWQAPVSGEGLVYARSVAVDAQGRAVVTGSFLSSVELGGETHENVFPFDEQEQDIVGTNYDAYVAAFESDGTYAWGFPAGWMRDENAVLADYADGRALVYRHGSGQLTLDAYDDGGAETWIGVNLDEPSSGLHYNLIEANESAVVLAGSVGEAASWPMAVAPYARGQSEALIIHFPR